MAAPGERLSLLAVATIFTVVIGTMYVGVQYSEGELPDREQATELESSLRAAIWERINDQRANAGIEPAPRDAGTRIEAQQTAGRLAQTAYFEAETAVGVRPTNGTLPNERPLCTQIPAKYTVRHSGWNETGEGTVSTAVTRHVANRTVALFGRSEATKLSDRPSGFVHGIGVAVRGDTVYVVYRYCNLVY